MRRKKPNTFIEAYQIAQTLEATQKVVREVNTTTTTTTEETHKLGYTRPQTKKQKNYMAQNKPSGGKKAQTKGNRQKESSSQQCNGCGGQHARKHCQFLDAKCHKCIVKVCKCKDSQNTDRITSTSEGNGHSAYSQQNR